MNHLLRELAPISNRAWTEVEAESKRMLKLMLAARKLVDISGPLGWAISATSPGRTHARSRPRFACSRRRRRFR